MPRILYVTPRATLSAAGGRAQLSRVHWNCIQTLFGNRAMIHTLAEARPSMVEALAGRVNGATRGGERALIDQIGLSQIRQVYFDGSNLGRLAHAVKQAFPTVEVLTFCHNVEARFFLGALRVNPSARALGVLVANTVAERMAVRASDRLIALSRRDSDGFANLYGRGATDILPMALAPISADSSARDSSPPGEDYLLFVGGAFYANLAGIRWYARHVAPHLSLPTIVVGHGLGALGREFAGHATIRLVGSVGDLGPWYHGARVVVAPIFDGSGMKTKVAEALMHGKRVVGTHEAFTGYEEILDQVGWRCDDAASFIATIDGLQSATITAFDPALRNLFDQRYSLSAARDRLAAILRP